MPQLSSANSLAHQAPSDIYQTLSIRLETQSRQRYTHPEERKQHFFLMFCFAGS